MGYGESGGYAEDWAGEMQFIQLNS
jgi:hypothetical protein